MFGMTNLTQVKGAKHQFFMTGGNTLDGYTGQYVWTIPPSTTMLFVLAVGGGGGGGAGYSGGTGSGGGGAGGNPGQVSTLLVPRVFLPTSLYIYIGRGGTGSATGTGGSGRETVVGISDYSVTNAFGLACGNGGSGGGPGGSISSGNPGTFYTPFGPDDTYNYYSGFGVGQSLPSGSLGGGGGGFFGGAGSDSAAEKGCPITGGGGGGGYNGVGFGQGNGGKIDASNLGMGFETATLTLGGTVTGDRNGRSLWTTTPFLFPGGGGGAANSTASATGGKGGKGAPGCGGGGGGAAPTGGAGGDGGDGFVYLMWW